MISDMKKCPKCNSIIENDSAKFCKKCGTNIEGEPTIGVEPPLRTLPIEKAVEEELPTEKILKEVPPIASKPLRYTYTPEINGFFAFVLWMIVIGGILTPVSGMFAFDMTNYANSIFLLISDMSIYVLTPIYAIYSVVSTYKRLSGAVVLLKAYLMSIMSYKILVLLMTGFASFDFSTIGGIIWNLIFLLYIFFAEKVRDNFPEETRKASTFDKVMIWSYILIPIITLMIGCLELML